jgi:RNA ligase
MISQPTSESEPQRPINAFPKYQSKELLARVGSLVLEGRLRKAVHPYHPLAIYNYTAVVQFRNEWDDLLMWCRGLVLDTNTGEVVACPMRKFFNYSEKKHDEATMKLEHCDVTEKLDGSLGIFFKYRDEWVFSSRGSFVSSQAERGMMMAKERKLEEKCKSEYTYLFEIIYPENRIVVNYGESRSDLVLIAMVHTQTAHDIEQPSIVATAHDLGLTIARPRYNSDSIGALLAENIKNEEGFIVRSRISGERVKLKFDEYLRLHAVRTRFSLKYVRQWFLEIPTDEDYDHLPASRLEYIPDEFFVLADSEWTKLAEKRRLLMIEFDEGVATNLEVDFRDVPQGPMKSWICKYLRLHRNGNYEEAGLVGHQYAMSCIKKLPDTPEPKISRPNDEEYHGEVGGEVGGSGDVKPIEMA